MNRDLVRVAGWWGPLERYLFERVRDEWECGDRACSEWQLGGRHGLYRAEHRPGACKPYARALAEGIRGREP